MKSFNRSGHIAGFARGSSAMDLDEVSLEQFKPTFSNRGLLWNHHDNILAILGDSSIYLLVDPY